MVIISKVLVALVALEHVYILVLEMFLWTKPQGLKSFNNTQEAANTQKVLAANQGLYNGFLAAGLFLGFAHSFSGIGSQRSFFFLRCVLVAGGNCGATRKSSGPLR